jgi:hypothetical protein
MDNEHIIGGLLRKRADIAGEIALAHDQLRVLQSDLVHVEATLRMFQPDIDFSGARVSRKPGKQAAGYGEMSKAVGDVLRGAGRPLTVRQVATEAMKALGLDAGDKDLVVTAERRVGASLRNLKRRGQADSRHGLGLALEWVLVREAEG